MYISHKNIKYDFPKFFKNKSLYKKLFGMYDIYDSSGRFAYFYIWDEYNFKDILYIRPYELNPLDFYVVEYV